MWALLLPAMNHASGFVSAVRIRLRFGRRCMRTDRWRASMQVKVYAVGRRTEKESWAELPVEEYTKRLSGDLSLSCDYLKDNDALLKAMRNKRGAQNQWCIALDERGSSLNSERFSELLYRRLEDSGGRVAFFVGGADGLPSDVKSTADELISLSKLTFTHK